MKFSLKILSFFLFLFSFQENLEAQNLTSSPYSRYGIGEMNQLGFANINAMGGTFIGLKGDTNAPVFINVANPAAIANIRYTTLELGGFSQFTNFSNSTSTTKNKTVNFSYACLGFPVRQKQRLALVLCLTLM